MRVRNSRRLAMILAWVLRSSTNLAPPPEISLVGMSIPASQKCVVKRWPHSARKQKQKLSYWLHKKLHERKDCGHYYGTFVSPWVSSIRHRHVRKMLSSSSRLLSYSSKNLLPTLRTNTYESISFLKPLPCCQRSARPRRAVLLKKPLRG